MKCHVIINPYSGKGRAVRVWEEVGPIFAESGWLTEVYVSRTRDITPYFRDCEAVIAIGGDGTVHQVINQAMRSSCKLPLGFIPAGTGNDLMRDLGCGDPREAARRLVEGKRRAIDVLEVTTDREVFYSVCVVGWGLFAAANQTAEKLRWLKGWRYAVAALWHILLKRVYPATLTIGDDVEEGEFITIFACNTIHTGRGMKLAPRARIDDGLMNLVIIKNDRRTTLLNVFKQVLAGQELAGSQEDYRQIAGFDLQTQGHQVLNIDGEVKGTAPFSVRVMPGAVELLM